LEQVEVSGFKPL